MCALESLGRGRGSTLGCSRRALSLLSGSAPSGALGSDPLCLLCQAALLRPLLTVMGPKVALRVARPLLLDLLRESQRGGEGVEGTGAAGQGETPGPMAPSTAELLECLLEVRMRLGLCRNASLPTHRLPTNFQHTDFRS